MCVSVFTQVSSKTVAQCVEFYYTYKKQVKIGRNGTLIYGDVEPPETKPTEEEVDFKVWKDKLCVCVWESLKYIYSVLYFLFTSIICALTSCPVLKQSSQKFEPLKQEEDGRKWERSADRKRESSPGRVTQSSVTTEHVSEGDYEEDYT